MNRVFFSHGYPCITIRIMEHYCGYVGLGKKHPFYRRRYQDLNNIEVHGGLTYSDDKILGMKNDSGMWFLGFDTAHGFDDCDTNREDYAIDQCKFLASQLHDIEKNGEKKIIKFKDAK